MMESLIVVNLNRMKVYDSNEKCLVFEPAVKWGGNPNIILVLKLLFLHIKIQVSRNLNRNYGGCFRNKTQKCNITLLPVFILLLFW